MAVVYTRALWTVLGFLLCKLCTRDILSGKNFRAAQEIGGKYHDQGPEKAEEA